MVKKDKSAIILNFENDEKVLKNDRKASQMYIYSI